MARKRSGPMTAAELHAELANDPEYQKMRREREAKKAEGVAKLRQEEASLVRELQDAGVHVILNRIPGQEYEGPPQSISDLVNTNVSYPNAIPILVKHMHCDYSVEIKEAIARSLSVPEARGLASTVLIEEFCTIDDPDSSYKWVLGMAIAETATPENVSSVVELVRDKRHGYARYWLPLALQWLPNPVAESLLQTLTDDPDVCEQALKALKSVRRRSH